MIKPKLGREPEETQQKGKSPTNPSTISRVVHPAKGVVHRAKVSNPAKVDNYTVTFAVGNLSDGSSGRFVVRVFPEWAPNSAERFGALVNEQFFDNGRFFRVIPGFVAQFGIAADPMVTAQWRLKAIKEDVPFDGVQNVRGRLAFAASGPGTRSTQIFINLADNPDLDSQGFPPFAEVAAGMDVIDKIFSGYGEESPLGPGPEQGRIEFQGNSYLDEFFPSLSYIQQARMGNESYQALPRLSFISLLVVLAILGSIFVLQRLGVVQMPVMKWRWKSLPGTVVHET